MVSWYDQYAVDVPFKWLSLARLEELECIFSFCSGQKLWLGLSLPWDNTSLTSDIRHQHDRNNPLPSILVHSSGGKMEAHPCWTQLQDYHWRDGYLQKGRLPRQLWWENLWKLGNLYVCGFVCTSQLWSFIQYRRTWAKSESMSYKQKIKGCFMLTNVPVLLHCPDRDYSISSTHRLAA